MRFCKDCDHFGGRAVFSYDGYSKVMCLYVPFVSIYPTDEACIYFEKYLPFYYRNDYLRKIICMIEWYFKKYIR